MSLQGSIAVQQKQRQSGAPFAQQSARNGTYVHEPDGTIRLGSDPFGPNPQPFIENVILDSNLFGFVLIDIPSGLQYIQIFPQVGTAKFGVLDFANLYMDSSGQVFITSKPGGGAPVRRVFLSDPPTFRVIVGDVDQQDAAPVFLNMDSSVGQGLMHSDIFDVSNNALNAAYSINGNLGASGTFTTADAKTVTVEGGLITAIV